MKEKKSIYHTTLTITNGKVTLLWRNLANTT